MKTRTGLSVVFAGLLLIAQAGAESTNTAATFKVALALVDGSRVLGEPVFKEIPVQSSFGAMQIPLQKIRSVTFSADHKNIELALGNGDRLTGSSSAESFKLKTLFGAVSIPAAIIKTISVSAQATGELPREGLVLWFDFHHFEGSEVLDMSGREHHGKLFHGARVINDAERGQVLALDGQAAHVRVAGSPDFHFTNFTAVVWMKRSSWAIPHDDPQPIFCTGTPTGREGGILLGLGEGPQFYWAHRPASDLPGPGDSADLDIAANDTSWHQLACTLFFEDGRCLIRAYKDGSLLKESTISSEVPAYSNQMLYLGINYDSPAAERGMNYSRQFQGCFSGYMVFDRALSAAEIAALYGAPPSAAKPATVPLPINNPRPMLQ